MAQLYYQGHGSYRIISDDGFVTYIDPYAGKGYDVPADLIIVTHEHGDHNKISLVTLKEGGKVLRHGDLFDGKSYQTYHFGDITVTGTPAENRNHPRNKCVGFIMNVDGKSLYGGGDTSYFPEMKDFKGLDYALLPSDGIYNMNIKEASRCADLIDTKVAIPIHMAPGKLFDARIAKKFTTKKALIVEPDTTLTL
ncbi:MAG: MBL fold metallo-hydrolase [Erysipelotrichaceae bacterium]|nr:MBL fold metallo-hydrolase [Erysipelotrichaceae bacterium]